MRHILIFVTFVASILTLTASDILFDWTQKPVQDTKYKLKTVVIDPGHGGKDPGCSGHGSHEKHIALDIGLLLGAYIEREIPDVKVIYTRSTDVFVPLFERAEIANRNKADLFISIHCNSFKKASAHGTETYVMGLHTAEENLDVAKRENESILLEEDHEIHYGGYDPNSPEGHIILSMYQNAYLDQSINFASKIEAQFKDRALRKSRGVKQAGFVVLRATAMPSVLIETGYLSNKTEHDYLASDEGSLIIASAVFRAFREYKNEVESETEYASSSEEPLETVTLPNKLILKPKNVDIRPTDPVEAPKPPDSAKPKAKKISITTPVEKVKVEKVEIDVSQNPTADFEISDAPPGPRYTLDKAKEHTKNIFPSKSMESIEFKVQLASSAIPIKTNRGKWVYVTQLDTDKIGKSTKYLSGGYDSYKKAVQGQYDLRNHGFNGAFVVAYQNGKRIPLKEAKKILGIQ